METSSLIIIAGVVLVIILVILASGNYPIFNSSSVNSSNKESWNAHNGEKGIDPVSDPAYNMKQVAKQCILLEEHIAEKNKRCRDCITKHFLHIIGLLNEALWLATTNVETYPYLREANEMFERLFNKWLANYTNEAVLQQILEELRRMRKKIIAYYYFGEHGETSCGGGGVGAKSCSG